MVARPFIAAACCAGLAVIPTSLARATSPGGALTTGPTARTSSAVTLVATPARPTVGEPVRLAVASPSPDARGFAWDLTGRGIYARHTGGTAHTETRFSSPGVHAVAVRFTTAGRTRLGVVTMEVAARPAPRRTDITPQRHRVAQALAGQVTAHAAGDPGVTVADFHFSPGSTTIHVGDTITWTNTGPSSHTAKARHGAFDTGVLKKGQSASHTFTQPGTFTYFCQIHPFMHGTIVVLAATPTTTAATTSTPSATTPAATTAATTAAATAAAQAGPTLPNTGFNVLAGLLAGLLLLGAGAALRRARPR
ncbi:MAG: cupredoxin domain-containing protein [Solirubrobacteraceae bacterium]